MFVYVSPGSSFKKKEEGEVRDWILLKSRWRFSLYLILIGNQIQSREKKTDHVFFPESIHWGGEGCCQPNFKKQLFIGMSFFFLAKFLCPHFVF